jgi:hypothetical protein
MHVVQPIVECMLLDRNIAVLHSAALSKDGKGILLMGRGGVKKTTYIMELLKQGWKYLADDMVLIGNKKLYAFPLGDTFFDYFYNNSKDEMINAKTMLGALLHVRRNRKISFDVEKESTIDKVNLLIGWKNRETKIMNDGIIDDLMIDKIIAEI